ncbi:GPR endopeptidase [Rubeoparvulum massiliense]|uniref:GPR endopeptidase n=1 Tax=Rubeoparvulum massiliense TaxID=1631346 RepID=UPI00065E179E|nr:GPR endopeptidase [Rubeoparvulum massiliense]
MPRVVRTDLAIDAQQAVQLARQADEIPGVRSTIKQKEGVRVSTLKVDQQGADEVGKLPGTYITFEAPGLRKKDSGLQDQMIKEFANTFENFLDQEGVREDQRILVVGLGNWNVTPDAVGPMVVKNLLITNHLFELMPDLVQSGYRPVSAITPGVMGVTGLETSAIVYGIIQQTKPDVVIAIDALATRSLERVNTTIQVTDTGIQPGSGVGNKRKPLTKDALGIPVFAIGVPTVVDATTIAYDTLELLARHIQKEMKRVEDQQFHEQLFGLLGRLSNEEKRQLIQEVLAPLGHDLIVTPKEVDDYVEDIANIIANGLNIALHEIIAFDDLPSITH